MSEHPDLSNAYLNEQGLKQERDALRAENERLRADLKSAVALIGCEWPDVAEEKEIYRLLQK